MREAEYNKTKRRVESFFTKWRLPLGLGSWAITFVWEETGQCSLVSESQRCAGDACMMHVSTSWEYAAARWTVHMPQVAGLNDKQLEKAFLHEAAHILVAQAMPPYAPSEGVSEEWKKHEEYVVTRLADVFKWLREEGQADEKKAAKARAKDERKPKRAEKENSAG
jgi:hypothetical protein